MHATNSKENISGRTWYRDEKIARNGAQHITVAHAGSELRDVSKRSRKVADEMSGGIQYLMKKNKISVLELR